MVPLFCLDIDDSVKGSVLSHAIEVLLDYIGEKQFGEMFIRNESVTHANYDVPPDVFATFYRVVADTIRDLLGTDWTAEMATAWRGVIDELSGFVAREASDATAEAGHAA